MKKTIRMTEGDLVRLVRRIVSEQTKPYASWKEGPWMDSNDREYDETPDDYSMEREFGPDEYDDFMEFINDCNTRWCLKTKQFYDRYAREGNIRVRK